MNWIDVLCVYIAFSVIILFITGPMLDAYGYKLFSWKTIFVFQYELYNEVKDELNIFGIMILELITTTFTLGTSLMLFVIAGLAWIFTLLWKLFLFIFRKRVK